MRYLFLLVILAGCEPMMVDSYIEAKQVPVALYQQPLCLFGCSNSLSTAGSRVEGGGSPQTTLTTSNTQTQGSTQ